MPSRIGKKPIKIPQGVEIKIEDQSLEIKGPKGILVLNFLPGTKIEIQDNNLYVKLLDDERQTNINHGTMRSLTFNAVTGVSSGFSKVLEIEGIGFKAETKGENLILNVGLSHSVEVPPLKDIKISVVKNQITVAGVDKAKVGEMAAKIRAIKKPEPYKGTGIRYKGEVIRRKAGKKVAVTGGAPGAAA